VSLAVVAAGLFLAVTSPTVVSVALPSIGTDLRATAWATFGLLRLDERTGIGAIWWDFAILGAGIGLSLTPMTAVAMSAVGAAQAGLFVNGLHHAIWVSGLALLGAAALAAVLFARRPPTRNDGQR
jgi:hypothetical protein